MAQIKIHSTGRILEYGSISDGIAFNLPNLEAIVGDPVNATTNGAAAAVGTTDPEGSVTAAPRRLYFNKTSQHVWLKQTGSGSTGWVDATAAAAPSGPTILSAVVLDTSGLTDGDSFVWDATRGVLVKAPTKTINVEG